LVIRQFDVFDNPSPASRAAAPFLVAMSSHHLEGMPLVLIAPLVRTPPIGLLTKVSVPARFADEVLMVSVAEMTPIIRTALGEKRGSLLNLEDEIRRALDRLFTGF
jgi:toxin CcdB